MRAAVIVKTQTKVLRLVGFAVLFLLIVIVGVSVWVTRGFAFVADARPAHLPGGGMASPADMGMLSGRLWRFSG